MGFGSSVPRMLFTSSLLGQSPSRQRSASGRRSHTLLRRAAVITAEAMESRLLFAAGPTATFVSAAPVTTSTGSTELVVATYVDTTTPVAAASITAANLTVSDPHHPTTPLTVSPTVTKSSTTNAATITATYTVSAPGGTNFNFADNGVYSIALTATVTDSATTPNPVAADVGFGGFPVIIPDPSNPTAPVAIVVSTPTVVSTTSGSEQLVIGYADAGTPLDTTTFVPGNITVTGPTMQSLTVSHVTVASTDANDAVVTYTVTPPGGANFATSDNGNYTIGLTATVANTSGTALTAIPAFGTFVVNVVNQPPVATVGAIAPITTAGVASDLITVTYVDNDAAPVKRSSISTAGITVANAATPPQTLTVSGVSVSSAVDGPTLIATYTVTPASGDFVAADNGTYTVSLGSTVTDTAGLAATSSSGPAATFTVTVPDTTRPTATASNTTVSSPNQFSTSVIVTYTDDVAIDPSTINRRNITVTSPSGTLLTVSNDSFTQTMGTTQVVTYTVLAPSGSFTGSDNGVYTVAVVGAGASNAVADTSGNLVVANPHAGGFTVSIADNSAPTAQITADEVVDANQSTETITVVYRDDGAINTSSIAKSNLLVKDPAGNVLPVASVTVDSTANGQERTATYIVNAINGGTFSSTINGEYTITLSGVRDTSGHYLLPEDSTSEFFVDISPPNLPPTLLGQFGTVNGKTTKLKFHDTPEGTNGTLTLKGGTGTAMLESDGTVDLTITDDGTGAVVNIQTSNGGPLTLNDVEIAGTVKKFTAPNVNVVGSFYVNGAVSKASFRQLLGSFDCTGPILNLAITRAVTGSEILSGADLENQIFGAGYIGKLSIGNGIVNTVIAAGVDPGADGIFGTSDDTAAGGTVSPIVQVIAPKGFDPLTTEFVAGAFGKFKIKGKNVVPTPAIGSYYVLLS